MQLVNLDADIVAGIRRVKSTDGPNLTVWGSSMRIPVLREQGWVYPVLLGGGKRLFSDSTGSRERTLVSTEATATLERCEPKTGLRPTDAPITCFHALWR